MDFYLRGGFVQTYRTPSLRAWKSSRTYLMGYSDVTSMVGARHTHIHAHTQAHEHTHACTHTRTYTHAHTHTHTHM